jgi:hypothetical protein
MLLFKRLRWSRGCVLAFSTQVRGFKPSRSRRIFQGEKILSMTSSRRKVKPSVPCRRCAACKRSLKERGTHYFRPNYRKFLAQQVSHFAARISSVVVMWSLLAVKVGTLNAHGVCTISLQAAVHPHLGPHTNNKKSMLLFWMFQCSLFHLLVVYIYIYIYR